MKLIINLVLFALIALFTWMLINSIREPIQFQTEKQKREKAVVGNLMQLRTLQECYRSITGEFTNNYDTLKHVLSTGQFMQIKVIGDPDDPAFTGEITYDTSYSSAKDSIEAMGINIDEIKFVPFTDKKVIFEMQADTITYQKTTVPVVEVGVKRSTFMGPYADAKFSRYDSKYVPGSKIKFGDMTSPNTAGNWE